MAIATWGWGQIQVEYDTQPSKKEHRSLLLALALCFHFQAAVAVAAAELGSGCAMYHAYIYYLPLSVLVTTYLTITRSWPLETSDFGFSLIVNTSTSSRRLAVTLT